MTDPISTTDAKAIVMRLYQAYASADADRIADCLTDDVIWVAPPGNATQVALGMGSPDDAGPPDGSNNLDKAAIIAFMTGDFRRFFAADLVNDFRLMIAENDHVVAETRMSATLANGRRYVNDYCFIYRVREGRVAAIREYMDTRGGWRQVFGDDVPGTIM